MAENERAPKSTVADLNLRYLEASFEAARKCANSLLLVNGGSIVVILSLLTILGANNIPPYLAAQKLQTPLFAFIVGISTAISSLFSLHISSHGAAWGSAPLERGFRWMTGGLILLSLICFIGGAWLAIQVVAALRPISP